MKFKKIMIVSLFLLAILTLGAVSASDDTDNLTACDAPDFTGAEDIDMQTDDIYQYGEDDELGDGPEVTIVTDEYNRDYGSTALVEYYFPENYTGSICITLDDETYYDSPIEPEEYVTIYGDDLYYAPDTGTYNMHVEYYGDEIDSDLKDKVTKDATLTVTEDPKEPYHEINVPDYYKENDNEEQVYLYFDDDVQGNVTLFVDNKKKYEMKMVNGLNAYLTAKDLGIDALDYGDYIVKVIYSGDENYKGFTKEYNLTVTYHFDVYLDYEIDALYYGDSASYDVRTPQDATGNVVYTVNGKKYTISAEDLYEEYDDQIKINATEFKYGYNEIIFQYVGDDYPLKTINKSRAILSPVKYGPTTIEFDQSSWVSLSLPGDAKGNLKLYKDDEWDEEPAVLIDSVALKNGFANITIDKFSLGYHSLYAEYDGTDYDIAYGEMGEKYFSIRVIPKITIPRLIFSGAESTTCNFKLPSTYSGDLTVTIGKETKTFTLKNGETSFEIFNIESATYDEWYPDSDEKSLNIKLQYENVAYEYYYNDDFSAIVTDIPNNVGFNFTSDKEVFKEGSYHVSFEFPKYAEGHVEVYMDGKKVDDVSLDYIWDRYYYNSLENTSMGKHDLEFRYSGDDYYNAVNKTTTVDVNFYDIDISDLTLGEYKGYSHDNQAIVRFIEDATGTVTLKIDDKIIETVQIPDKKRVTFDLDNLTRGTHTFEISYTGNYPSFTKKETRNVDYEISSYADANIYGMKNYIEVILPIGATGKVTAKINDKTYSADLDENSTATIDVSDLTKGEYTAFINYAGDSKFPALKTNTTFEVDYKILINFDYEVFYLDLDNATISLTLPKDASGSLVVYEKAGYDDETGDVIYKLLGSEKLVDGKVKLSLSDLNITQDELIRDHYLKASYSGDDYDIDSYSHSVEIKKYKYTEQDYYEFELGNDKTFTFELPPASHGNVQVYKYDYNNKKYNFLQNVSVFNGKATYSTSKKEMGKHNYKFIYNDTKVSFEEYGSCIVWPENITVNLNATCDEAVMTVELPSDAKGKLTVLFWKHGSNDKNYKGDEISIDYSGSPIVVPASKLENGEYTLDDIQIEDEIYGTFYFGGTSLWFALGYYEDGIVISGSNATHPTDVKNDTQTNPGKTNETANNDQNTSNPDVIGPNNPGNNDTNTSIDPANNDQNTSNPDVIGPNIPENNDTTNTTTDPSDVPANNTETVDPKITASDFSMFYNDGSYYAVRVYGTDGEVAAKTNVEFKLDGKTVKNVQTDANGYAKIKITQLPKTYKISATALGVTVTKKLTVKKVLTLKKVSVKKSLKKLTLTATLKKVKGKYLKGKKITFKFNGKKYKAKTDKKGVAKVTIKKSVLKKLKAGKKIKYQATYVKSTVKYTIKVKK